MDRQPHWSYLGLQGGARIEAVPDPRFGSVLKSTVADSGPTRAHMAKEFDPPFDIGNRCSVKLPVWLSKDYQPGSGGWASFISVFSKTEWHGGDFDILAMIDMGSNGMPYIAVREQHTGELLTMYRGRTRLLPERWYTLDLRIEGNTLHLLIDNTEEAFGPKNDKVDNRITMIHGGAYGDKLPPGSYILNGPFQVNCW